jgi:hypothetical protein
MTPSRLVSLLALSFAGAACNENPAEVRSNATQFPLRATWNASALPVGTSTVRATLSVKQYDGFRMDASLTVTGAAGATYQWRIFRGDCATSVAATANTDPNGVLLFETIQSYPDVTTNSAGTATITRVVAGSLDSLTTYSVRLRAAQTATNWNGLSPISCGNLQRSAGG